MIKKIIFLMLFLVGCSKMPPIDLYNKLPNGNPYHQCLTPILYAINDNISGSINVQPGQAALFIPGQLDVIADLNYLEWADCDAKSHYLPFHTGLKNQCMSQ